jgi:hypothetical protein
MWPPGAAAVLGRPAVWGGFRPGGGYVDIAAERSFCPTHWISRERALFPGLISFFEDDQRPILSGPGHQCSPATNSTPRDVHRGH